MNLEDNIFKRHIPDFAKLEKFRSENTYKIVKIFYNNQFKAEINISSNGHVSGKVYDLESQDEFLPLRVENFSGGYISEVKNAYENVLNDIREKYFIRQYFIYPQSNRITNLIIQKYNDEPEFLWEKLAPGSGVFRNKKSRKWYAAILDVDRSKLQKNKKGIIEVINLKLEPEEVSAIVQEPYFYHAYHMNKKYWISIILDDTVSDEKIMELVAKSHSFT